MSTHIAAAPGEVADTVLLPGDPLRAQWIATTYLDGVMCYSKVRNMLGFTGTYRGRRVSVQGTGMGQPSLSIYVNELLTDYGATTLVRVGSCGAMAAPVRIRDLVIGLSAATDSAMNAFRFEGFHFAPTADYGLVRGYADRAGAAGARHHIGQVFSSDSFYENRPELRERLVEYGVLAVEMEAAELYTLAAKFGARALAVSTVSDSLVTGESTTAAERERTFATMVELALETVSAETVAE